MHLCGLSLRPFSLSHFEWWAVSVIVWSVRVSQHNCECYVICWGYRTVLSPPDPQTPPPTGGYTSLLPLTCPSTLSQSPLTTTTPSSHNATANCYITHTIELIEFLPGWADWRVTSCANRISQPRRSIDMFKGRRPAGPAAAADTMVIVPVYYHYCCISGFVRLYVWDYTTSLCTWDPLELF